MLTLSFLLLGTVLGESSPDYEQLTADYFFGTIWKQKYEHYKSIEFDNRTDTSIYLGHVYGCKEWAEDEKKEIATGQKNEPVGLNSRGANTPIKERSSSKRLKLTIGSKIQVGDEYIVQISVYKPFEFVDHYFIKLNMDGQIIDRCEFNEII